MEAAVSAREFGTGTATMAAQLPADVAKHSGKPALRYKAGDEWHDISFDELGEAVREIALGLVDIGIEPRERVAILCHTRPEWTLANFGILTAGATRPSGSGGSKASRPRTPASSFTRPAPPARPRAA